MRLENEIEIIWTFFPFARYTEWYKKLQIWNDHLFVWGEGKKSWRT